MQVLPIIALLVLDENTNVRLAVINELSAFIQVVGLEPADEGIGADQGETLLALVQRLSADKNWRVRHGVMLLLPAAAQELGRASFDEAFGVFLQSFALDDCALIREDFLQVVARLVPIFGKEWLVDPISKLLLSCSDSSRSYQLRMVLPRGLELLGDRFSRPTLELLVYEAVAMAESKVPNLRIAAVKALGSVIPLVTSQLLQQVVLPALKVCYDEDDDIDVKFFASEVLTRRAP